MALLNFKYGLHKNLPAFSDATIGNVFVTTDEQAMHIDLPGGRVVISQIITLATAEEWQSMKPPYNQQAFYYIVDANALLKYTGNGTVHSWKQVNSTADVQNAIDSLTALVGTKDAEGKWTEGSLGADVATHTTDITNIKQDIKDLQDADDAFEKSLQNITKDVTDVEALVHTLEGVVGYAGAFDTEDAAKAVVEDKEVCLIGNKLKLCSVDSEGNKGFVDYNTVVVEIELLKKTVKDLQETTASNTTIIDLQSRVKVLEDWKKDVIGVPAEGDTPASGIYILIANAQAQADTAKQIADQAVADAKKANDAIGNDGADGQDKTGMHAAIAKNATDIATNAGNIKTNADDIDALEGRAGAVEGRADALEGRADAVEGRADALETTVGDAESGLVKKANDNATAIGLNTTAITNEIARAKEAEEANAKAIGDLRKEVMEDIQTADAMVFKDVVANEVELTSKEATAQIGHTYKASDEFEIDGTKVHIGDLLIATGEEDAETGYIKNVTWKHVPSGYVADYNPKIEAAEDVAGDNKVVLALSSGVAKDEAALANRGDLGKITLATAEGSALTVSTDNAGKVTFSMVWESFDPAE